LTLPREEDKNVLEKQIISNVKNLVFPYVKKLRNTVQKETEKSIIRILESNLKNILSTFSLALSSEGYGLTSTEMLIADLIRNGKRTKKIAEMNNISQKTVEVHRNNIRRKLGINGKKVNLQTYLRSINN
jgi:DNA-binding CsgD family transcriptional regulator